MSTGRLVVLGATGGTGQHLVAQALAAGIPVAVLARRPEAMAAGHPNLTVVRGDAMDPASLRGVLGPDDRVVSALGIGQSRAATALYSRGTANVLDAMRDAGTRRLICLSTSGLEVYPGGTRLQRLVTRHLLQRLLHRPYADMRRMEELARGSDADWTVVRAARLTDGPRRGRYRVGTAGTLRALWSISRADLAAYLLSILDDRGPVRQTVDIAY